MHCCSGPRPQGVPPLLGLQCGPHPRGLSPRGPPPRGPTLGGPSPRGPPPRGAPPGGPSPRGPPPRGAPPGGPSPRVPYPRGPPQGPPPGWRPPLPSNANQRQRKRFKDYKKQQQQMHGQQSPEEEQQQQNFSPGKSSQKRGPVTGPASGPTDYKRPRLGDEADEVPPAGRGKNYFHNQRKMQKKKELMQRQGSEQTFQNRDPRSNPNPPSQDGFNPGYQQGRVGSESANFQGYKKPPYNNNGYNAPVQGYLAGNGQSSGPTQGYKTGNGQSGGSSGQYYTPSYTTSNQSNQSNQSKEQKYAGYSEAFYNSAKPATGQSATPVYASNIQHSYTQASNSSVSSTPAYSTNQGKSSTSSVYATNIARQDTGWEATTKDTTKY